MTPRNRLTVLVALAAAPPLALLTYNTIEWRDFLEQQAHAEATASARLISAELTQVVDGSRNIMLALAKHPAVPDREQECSDYFRSVLAELPIYRAAAVIDREGKVHCSTAPMPPEFDVRVRDYFKESLSTGRITVGELTTGGATGERTLHVSMPYKRDDGRFDGVAVLALNPDALEREFSARPWQPHHRLTVLDRQGQLVFTIPPHDEAEARTVTKQVFEQTRYWPPGSLVAQNSRGEREIVGYVPLDRRPDGLFVAVGIDREIALAQVWDIAWRTMIFVIIAVLLALLGATVAAYWLLERPIMKLVDVARRREAGDTGAQFPRVARGTELGLLSAALSGMSNKVDELLEQKEFLLRELQHRVMNSLQILSSLLMLQSRHADPATRKQLAQARDRVLSMGAVYKHLYRSESTGPVDFGEYLQLICRESERAYGGTAKAPITCETTSLMVTGSQATSLAVLTHELITNALKHAYPEGEAGPILVRLARLEGGGVELRVADRGRGMPENLKLDDGSSLGLKVIMSTARQFGGTMEINRLNPGTEFVIRFPPGLEVTPQAAA